MATVNSETETRRAFGGRYRLLDFVGEGSNARVYVAEDLTLRRRVALKILRAGMAEDEGFLERFAEEMRATSALRHPRVLPVYDWGLEPQPYTVTEHLTGGSLASVLRAGHRLTPSQALVVGLEVARALVNIHAGGRAHLGLAPSSILFDSAARPYISDLGLAAALIGEASGEQTSAPASYSASEQAQDIRDLALILCEAVTGARDLTVDAGDSDPVPIAALGPLQMALERAATADPAVRLSAAEVASELLRVAPLLPRPDPLPLAISEVPSADSGSAAAGVSEALEQVGPSVSQRSAVPLDDAPRRRWPGVALAAVLVLGGAVAGIWAWISSGPDAADVPELQGQTPGNARAVAADSGWEVDEILVRAAGTERGEVVRTEPSAGTSLSEGATLEVFVSLGEPLIVLSDLGRLYGLTVDDATEALEAEGLGLAGQTLVNDEIVPPGNVIGLDVGEGVYELEIGSEVDLLVSDGPADRTIPAVPASREPGLAVDMLNSLQLTPRIVMEFSGDVPDGTVIGFRPTSGNAVPVESAVDVRVSRGPVPPVEPPVIEEGVLGPESEEDQEEEDSQ